MLEELQVPFDRSMARPQSEESKQYHPLGKIPALVVNNGEFCIYESASINSYLGDAYKSNLVPQHASISAGGSDYQTFVQRRAKYDQTVTFIMSEMDAQGLWIQRKHETLAKLFGKSPEAVQEAKRQFENANRVLYDQLNPYLLGEHFSAADILYAHCLEWATDIGWDGGDAFMNGDAKLQHYLEQCQSRPAYVRAAARRKEEEQAKAKYLKEKAAKKKHDLRSKI
jgi:glutathione S-transferase